jgi:glycosyltransferase involved in cell wall biosynthesis
MEKGKIRLSIAVAVFNEEKNIGRCLDSISEIADEVVVVDGGSTDGTVEIAKKHGAIVISSDNPPIFHINKQKALVASHGDWIFQIDADEVVPSNLAKEILTTINDPQTAVNGYYIPRKNYFWGHFMKKGGQYPDYVIRLFKRGSGMFPCTSVHEQIAIAGAVGHLTYPLFHYSYQTREDYWKKADAYTSLTAVDMAKSKAPKNIWSTLTHIVWKPLTTFLNIFIRHKGFMDGITGFEFALYSGMHWAIAYKKYLRLMK